jgi:hypothetical protein
MLAGSKVFKLEEMELGERQSCVVSKKISFAEMTTRKHYPGVHRVEVQLNGACRPLGRFELR